MNLKTCITFVCLLSLFSLSCRHEDLANNLQDPKKEITVEAAKAWYENVQAEKGDIFNKEIARKIGTPDWKSAYWQKTDPATPALLMVDLNINFGGYGIRRLVFTKSDGEIKGVILQCVGELGYLQQQKGIIDSKNFTGDAHFLNLSGRLIGGYRLKDGKIAFELKPTEEGSATLETTSTGESNTEGWVTLYGVSVYAYSGWTYMNVYSFYSNMGVYNYQGCTNCNTPPVYYYGNTSGGGSGGTQPTTGVQTINNLVTNPCLNEVYNKITTPQFKSELTEMIRNFNTSTTVNLTIKQVTNLSSNVFAKTYGTGGENYTIELNVNILPKTSQEWIAATYFHEVIHAYIKNHITDYDFKNNSDHKIMFENYFDQLVSTIKEIYPTISDRNARCMVFYDMLAADDSDSNAANQIVYSQMKEIRRLNIMRKYPEISSDADIIALAELYSTDGPSGTRTPSCQ